MAGNEEFFARNIVAEKLARNELVTSVIVKFVQTPAVATLIKSAGFDTFFIDMEHSTFTLEVTSQICQAALGQGLTPFVRVPAIEGDFISRVLDGGALGVIGPHIETVDEAERLVKYAKYPPKGKRGAGGALPHYGFRRFSSDVTNPIMDRITMVATMIETANALDRVDDIAKVDGVDILLVGAHDLSSELGVPGHPDHPKIEAAVMKILEAAQKRKKHVWLGGLMGKHELLQRLVTAGARVISTGSDVEILTRGFNERAVSTKPYIDALETKRSSAA